MMTATYQPDASRIVKIEIAPQPLPTAAIEALRAFWRTLSTTDAAHLNVQIRETIAALRVPAELHSNIALGFLWAALPHRGLDAAWDAYAAAVRWPALVSG